MAKDQWEKCSGSAYGHNIVSEWIDELSGHHLEQVRIPETGEVRVVDVRTGRGETAGDGIAEGRFKDKK